MATYLRKCVAAGPSGVISPGVSQPQDFGHYVSGRYGTTQDNLFFIADTGTRWVRFWVPLAQMWPTQASMNTVMLDALDFNIAAARVYGANVIITISHQLPTWLTGQPLATVSPFPKPNDTSSAGTWAQMLNFFVTRYNRNNTARPYGGLSLVDVVEICNEPNLLWTPDGVVGTVGDLMKTARALVGYYGNTPLIGAPCVHDLDATSVNRLSYFTFTTQLLDYLNLNGFYGVRDANGQLNAQSVVWTMHNYNDVQRDHGPGTTAPDAATYFPGDPDRGRDIIRTRRVAQYMNAKGWQGWPNGTAGVPSMFVTEGGADIHDVMTIWPSYAPTEAASKDFCGYYLLSRHYNRMGTDDQGYGVSMITNYLFYSDHRHTNPSNPNSSWVFGDTGLLDDAVNEGGAARYYPYTAFKSIPGRL